ncbi:hypothetical protein D1007_26664 [Hordeum vulgare]|nr:hypothetical protein D1007_26664 [Hordeum vulgare]
MATYAQLDYNLSGCKLTGLGFGGDCSMSEIVRALQQGTPSIEVHRGPKVMDSITRRFLMRKIHWRLFYAKDLAFEVGENDYKVSIPGDGGLVEKTRPGILQVKGVY